MMGHFTSDTDAPVKSHSRSPTYYQYYYHCLNKRLLLRSVCVLLISIYNFLNEYPGGFHN